MMSIRAGAQVLTLGTAVFDQLYDHPLTEAGLEQFAKDWQAVENR